MIYEATCLKCWETFNPTPSLIQDTHEGDADTLWMNERGFTPEDMQHGIREDGTECGGDGQLEGSWSAL